MVTSGGRGERGFTFMEMVLCLGILVLLASSLVVAEARDFRFARLSHDRAAALRACSGRLEEFAAGAAAAEPGERPFPLPAALAGRFPGAVATERVRPAGKGLVEVVVTVRWEIAGGDHREVHLATLVAREGAR